jgi:hypothetical protein
MRKTTAALLLLALVACSNARTASKTDLDKYGTKTAVSGSPVASDSPVAVSAKDAWLTAANQVCADLNNEFVALSAEQPATQAALLRYLDQVIAVFGKLETKLRAIPGTYGRSGQPKAFSDAVATTVRLMQSAINALKAGNLTAAQTTIAQGQQASDKAQDLGRQLGLNSCVLPGG